MLVCIGIKGIDVSVQLEDVNDSASLSFGDDLIGKLLEDAIFALGVGIRKSTLGSVLTKSKMIGFGCMSLGCQDNITKTFTVGKLTEHQYANNEAFIQDIKALINENNKQGFEYTEAKIKKFAGAVGEHLSIFNDNFKDIKSALILGLFTWIIISEKPNQREEDNDLKYRYIKMKGDASAEQIATLEDIFELNRNNEVINQMSEDVETYEEAVRKQAALAEQARLKEQAAKEQESKANSIKNKQDDSKVNLNNKSKP